MSGIQNIREECCLLMVPESSSRITRVIYQVRILWLMKKIPLFFQFTTGTHNFCYFQEKTILRSTIILAAKYLD